MFSSQSRRGPPPEAVAEDPADWALARTAELAQGRMDAEQAQAQLLRLFGGDRIALVVFSREIVYRLAEDPEVRDELLPPAGGEAAAGPSTSYPRLAAVASDALRTAMS